MTAIKYLWLALLVVLTLQSNNTTALNLTNNLYRPFSAPYINFSEPLLS